MVVNTRVFTTMVKNKDLATIYEQISLVSGDNDLTIR